MQMIFFAVILLLPGQAQPMIQKQVPSIADCAKKVDEALKKAAQVKGDHQFFASCQIMSSKEKVS
jgi:hypothetical protein